LQKENNDPKLVFIIKYMRPGTRIEKVLFRDNVNSQNLIDILFETEIGVYLFKDFTFTKVSEPGGAKWTAFEKFNETFPNGNKIESIKFENDLSLAIKLSDDWFLCVYFIPSNSSIYSDHVLDIFRRDELSPDFLEALENIPEIVVD